MKVIFFFFLNLAYICNCLAMEYKDIFNLSNDANQYMNLPDLMQELENFMNPKDNQVQSFNTLCFEAESNNFTNFGFGNEQLDVPAGSDEQITRKNKREVEEEITENSLKKSREGHCDICDKDYKRLSDHKYQQHGKGNQKVPCLYCDALISLPNLQRHIKAIHGEGSQKVSCTVSGCNAIVAAYAMGQHLKTHAECFQCQIKDCGFKRKYQASIIFHLAKKHHLEKPWKRYYSRVPNDAPSALQ